ncbi:hypothetical protein ACIBQ5_24070 [Streptomyces massasporeus]|uniref:hypothetical protein n=1 Tax=Streptomyces massasporeus TaxID=67324 RepID=UPI00379CFF04
MQQHERLSGRRSVPALPSRRPRVRLALATAAAAALTGTLLSATAGPATAADNTYAPRADFNGDGIGDVAFSASGAYVSGKKDAGQLVVLYGSASGINTSSGTQAFAQSTAGVPGSDEKATSSAPT